MEIFSFFQNLQLLKFGQNLTQGSQENQGSEVAEPGVFEAFMAEFKTEGEQAEQSQVLVADKGRTPATGNFRTFRPVNISDSLADVSQKVETKTEAPKPSVFSGSWKNLFADTRRVSDIPVRACEVPEDVEFDDGVVADYSDDTVLKDTPETIEVPAKKEALPGSVPERVKPAGNEPVVPETPEPVVHDFTEAPKLTSPEVHEAEIPEEVPENVSETSKPIETTKPEVPVSKPEPLIQSEAIPESERAENIETEPALNEPKKIEQPRPEVPELHQETVKPSEIKTAGKVSDDKDDESNDVDVKEIPETPREVRHVDVKIVDKTELKQPDAVTQKSEVETKIVDDDVVRESDSKETEEPEVPEKPKSVEAPEVPEVPKVPGSDTAVIMAGFSALQNTPQIPAAPDVPADEASDASRPTRTERSRTAPRPTTRTTLNSQEVKPEVPEQVQPETRTQPQTQTEEPQDESPKPQVSQQKNSVTENPVKDKQASASTTDSRTATTRTSASRTTEKAETRKADVHSDFQSFFDGITRTRRTSSTARVNTQPLSLRTSTYTEQPQGSTLRSGIVNVVRFIRSDSVRKANIIVDPPALGRISVELTSSSSGVEASIKVASEQIRQILQDQVTQLRDNLLQQGVQVSEFTVDVQQDNSRQGQNSGNGNQQSQYDFTAGNAEDEDTEDFRVDLEEGLLYWVA